MGINNELELIESEIVVEDYLTNIRTRSKRKMAGQTAVDNTLTTAILELETKVHTVAMNCTINKIEQ